MERYCKYCGAQLPPSGNFCGKCGMPVGSGEDMFGSAEPTVDSYHYGDMNSGRGAAGGPVRPGQKKPGNGKTVLLAVAASLVLLVGVALAVKLILELRGEKDAVQEPAYTETIAEAAPQDTPEQPAPQDTVPEAPIQEAPAQEEPEEEAAAVVMDVARELRLSQFAPAAEELRFAPGGPLPPIEYRAKTGSGLLTGQIDRVDTYEADGRRYFRIIDYKTGHKDFDYAELLYGKNLQMLLYLFALESYQRRAGTPMQPAGVLYVPGRCDMVKLKPGEDPAQADAERQKDLRRKGLLLNDEAVLHAMEAYEKKPQYLPFAPGPDGLIGDLASPAQLAELERFVNGQVEAMIDEILSGATAPNPIDRGPSDSECKYCDFSSACHKDVCSVNARRFASVTPEEFWQALERRLEHG